MYKIRFHLAKGDHYMHWQIKTPIEDGRESVLYYDPSMINLRMLNCKLVNQSSTAKKIFKGDNKSVCAWIECEDYEIIHKNELWKEAHQLRFNPRVLPFWHVPSREYHNLDGCFIKKICTNGKQTWMAK